MKTGKGFQPSRLTEAREARDLTMTALADLIGRKTPSSISHYENGRHEPSPEAMTALAEALQVPVAFFFQVPRPETRGPTFFRSMAAASKRARTRASRRIDWTWDILRFIEQHIEIAPVDLPDSPEQPWQELDRADIESAATKLRRHWDLGDGPISNLVWLAERFGCVVVRDSIGNKKLDAHSSWCGNRTVTVLNSDKRSAVRSRFDLAHELGHLVLHRDVSDSELRKSGNLKEIESQANTFAGAFLLPAESFADEACPVSLDGLLALKLRWRVSVAAMLKRSQALRLITKADATRLWKACSSRGWRKKEPYDDEILPEQPRMLERAFQMILEHNLASREGILAEIHLSEGDIERLAGLGEGFLSAEETQVLQFRPKEVEG